VLGRADA